METLRSILATRYREAASAASSGSSAGSHLRLKLLRDDRVHAICRSMHSICNTRGHKAVAKFMPHEIADLEPCLHALLSCDRADADRWHTPYILLLWLSVLVLVPFGLESANSSLLPALAKHAGAAGSAGLQDVLGTAARRPGTGGLVDAIEAACRSFLADASTVRGVAALAIARLMSRPDMAGERMRAFCAWTAAAVRVASQTAKGRMPAGSGASIAAIAAATSPSAAGASGPDEDDDEDRADDARGSSGTARDGGSSSAHAGAALAASAVSRASFLLQGLLRAAVLVAKHSHRDALMEGSSLVGLFEAVVEAAGSQSAGEGGGEGAASGSGSAGGLRSSQVSVLKQSSTLRKLLVKLAQRTALAQLPPRLVSWRYSRGKRSLVENMGLHREQDGPKAASGGSGGVGRAGGPGSSTGGPGEEQEEPEDVPEVVEVIVDELLHGLRDRDTVVRWSAAKGIGRITGRLGRVLADDVVAAVLDLLVPEESDSAWHGGCLAMAELARRGLLLPGRLPDVVPLVCKALLFDVRRGAASVGSHVRDAACYVCWAFARAYEPQVMRPFVPVLARGMLLTALFDREINCRRAASAAYQENVGRQGSQNFPAGIAILTAADYYSLGNRSNAFCHVAGLVALADPTLLDPMIAHLRDNRLRHWDFQVRENAADALAALGSRHPGRACKDVLEALVPQVSSPDHLRRHGAMLGVARVLGSLAKQVPGLRMHLKAELVSSIRMIIPRAERARAYTGRGGERVREAACEVISATLLAGVPFSRKGALRILHTLRECLKHPQESVQLAALDAFRLLSARNFSQRGDEDARTRLAGVFSTEVIEHENPAVRRGAAMALGSLPRSTYCAPGDSAKPAQPAMGSSGKRLPAWAAPPSIPADAAAACKAGGTACLDLVLSALVRATQQESRASRRDAETRRNACTSLAALAEGIGLSQEAEGQGCLSQAQLTEIVRALVAASADYAMDTRGDVGSWVRIAAARALERVLRLALAARLRIEAGCIRTRGRVLYAPPPSLLDSLGVDGSARGRSAETLQLLRAGHWPSKSDRIRHREWGVCVVEKRLADGALLEVSFPAPPAGTSVSPGSLHFPYGNAVVRTDDTVALGDARVPEGGGSSAAASSLEEEVRQELEGPWTEQLHVSAVPAIPTRQLRATIGALLRLSSERLDSVRDSAATALTQLLHDRVVGAELAQSGLQLIAPLREHAKPSSTTAGMLLAEAWQQLRVEGGDEAEDGGADQPASGAGSSQPLSGKAVGINYGVPASCFSALVPLLELPTVGADLLEGLCMSMGGMTESTARASEEAVVDWCAGQLRTRPKAAGGGEAPSPALLRVAYGICAFLRGRLDASAANSAAEAHGTDPAAADASSSAAASSGGSAPASGEEDLSTYKVKKRMVVPVLRTAHALLSRAALDAVMRVEPHWTQQLLRLVRFRCMRSTEVSRLLAAADVFLDLWASPVPACRGALQSALDLLGHEFPKVRRVCAERAYSKTLELQDHLEAVSRAGGASSDLDAALALLSETEWDGEAGAAILARDALYAHFGLAMPALRLGKPKPDGSRMGWPSSSQTDTDGGDDHATYLALVREVGY